MLGVQGVPVGALLLGPSLEGGGVVLAGVVLFAGLVVGALPGLGPGRVPPRVDGGEGTAGGGSELSLSGFAACFYQPAAQGEAVVVGVCTGGEVAVEGGVCAGVVESGAGWVDAAGSAGLVGGVLGAGCDPEFGQELLLLGA